MMAPILAMTDVDVRFRLGGVRFGQRPQDLYAVRKASIEVARGEAVAVVGESGSGKTTLIRAILGLAPVTGGRILFDGTDIAAATARDRRAALRRVQMVFQDPFGSLDPRLTVEAIIAEPLVLHGIGDKYARRARVGALLETVGLPRDAGNRYPHQFSGGQRQRIAIARALAPEPDLVLADEPLSALDVSIQSQILNLLSDLRRDRGLAYLIVSHDLAAVHHIADRVAVMYLGAIVEMAPRNVLFSLPAHPYTAALLAARPRLGHGKRVPGRAPRGEVPSPLAPPPGCAFHPRCPRASDICRLEPPRLQALNTSRAVACHHPLEAP